MKKKTQKIIIASVLLLTFSVNMAIAEGNLKANTQSPRIASPKAPTKNTPVSASKKRDISIKNAKITAIRNKNIRINYQLPLAIEANIERIEIWYSRGFDGPWQLFGYDKDRRGPAWFIAPTEGIFNLLIVAVDKENRYSCAVNKDSDNISIASTVKPHQTIFVDYTRPQLFLSTPMLFHDDQNKVVQGRYILEWTGFDTYLGTDAVTISWANIPSGKSPDKHQNWQPMSEPKQAVGEFVWDMPHDMTSATIKVELTDLAGNSKVKYTTIDLNNDIAHTYNALPANKELIVKVDEISGDTKVQVQKISEAEIREKAMQFYSKALFESQRDDWTACFHNCKKVLELLPDDIQAQLLIGDALIELGDAKNADEYFMKILAKDPNNDSAMLGHIQSLNAQGKIEEAAELMDKRNRRRTMKFKK